MLLISPYNMLLRCCYTVIWSKFFVVVVPLRSRHSTAKVQWILFWMIRVAERKRTLINHGDDNMSWMNHGTCMKCGFAKLRLNHYDTGIYCISGMFHESPHWYFPGKDPPLPRELGLLHLWHSDEGKVGRLTFQGHYHNHCRITTFVHTSLP